MKRPVHTPKHLQLIEQFVLSCIYFVHDKVRLEMGKNNNVCPVTKRTEENNGPIQSWSHHQALMNSGNFSGVKMYKLCIEGKINIECIMLEISQYNTQ